MTLDLLDIEISLRKDELEDINKRKAYEYISSFMDKNKLDNMLDFLSIDIWEFIKCSLYLNCKDKNIDRYIDLIDNYKEFFSKIDKKLLENNLNILNYYLNKGEFDKIIDYFSSKGLIDGIKKMNQFSESDGFNTINLVSFKKKINNSNIDIIPFLELIKENGRIVIDLIKYEITISSIYNFLRGSVIEVDMNVSSEIELENRKAAALARKLNDFYNVDDILKRMHDIKNFKEEFERVERNNIKEKMGLDNSRKELERNLENKQIIRYRDIIKGIKSPKIKYLFLEFIKEHNEKYYEELLNEHDKLKQDSKISIQALLNDYGIPKDSYDFEELPFYSKDELEMILKVISLLNISNELKISIIKNTSIEKIIDLKSYLDREIISVEFVSSNIELLYKDFIKLDNLKNNIELLKNKNISISLFTNQIDILMNNPNIIDNNLKILESYDLLGSINDFDFSFIIMDNLEVTIDKYLELGFEEYLIEDLDLLNRKELKRLDVLKSIGIPINSKEELKTYLDEEKEFFISLDSINNYIQDDREYVDEPEEQISIEELDKYNTNRVYDFNGIKISVQKVNRLLENGYSLYQSIIYNTFLSEDELKTISKIVKKSYIKELIKQE